MVNNYKETIFLPQTSFPMKADLAQKEPEFLKKWQDELLYKKIREKSKGRPKFILHAGPPYANGHLHMGHAFTGIIKDVVVRTQQMLGYDAPLVLGWDCHGLPIEWKIEEKYRKEKIGKEDLPVLKFRQECRAFAQHWIHIQKEEQRRLGVSADYENPYITMDFKTEAAIIQEFFTLLEKGEVYKGYKPVMWSVVEKTALAEAEVEYHDRQSPSIYVRFPIIEAPQAPDLVGASVVIWTTTPWTLPANRAIAYNDSIKYVLVEVKESLPPLHPHDRFIVAEDLLGQTLKTLDISKYKVIDHFLGDQLQKTKCHHPLHHLGYTFAVPLLAGDHVTVETGTGFVHTAPSHGLEDFELGKKYGLEIPEWVQEDGTYADAVPYFSGMHIFKVAPILLEKLKEQGHLLHETTLLHSYPHSWRSKAPLIYRATPQWFVSLENHHLRQRALEAVEQTNWYPSQSKNRMRSMIERSPDWCLSRQRAWGIPLPVFIHKATGQPLIDSEINKKIVDQIAIEGTDLWFDDDRPHSFLAPQYTPEDFDVVRDILDVWFEAGSSFSYVLESRPELSFPADLYFEGSDQHRGWFQKSLLVSCGTRGKAPFKGVATHGFTTDEHGHKMSKSLGNGISPLEVADTLGVEILRLWTVSCDYADDLKIGQDILKRQQDLYRRFRNTIRYLLGALKDFNETEIVPYSDLPELEKWVCHRLSDLNQLLKESAQNYNAQSFYSALHTFCASDLSAFYLDIRKDSLYCDDRTSIKRRSTRTAMAHIFNCICHWLAPVLCFTAEEAWQTFKPGTESIHLSLFPQIPEEWHHTEVMQKIEQTRLYRKVMTGALEEARAKGKIGSSLQAHLSIYDPKGRIPQDFDYRDLAIVSTVEILLSPLPENAYTLEEIEDFGVLVENASGKKCERCWKVLEEVLHSPTQDLCQRCNQVLKTEAVG